MEDYEVCDQVWGNYGTDKSDADFLHTYHFTIPAYAATTTVLKIDAAMLMHKMGGMSPHISDWLQNHPQRLEIGNLILTDFKLNFKSALSLSPILTAARLLTQTKAQTLTPSCETAILAGSSLGLAHEQRMWSMLRIVLNAAVEEYGGDPADQLQNDQLTAGLT